VNGKTIHGLARTKLVRVHSEMDNILPSGRLRFYQEPDMSCLFLSINFQDWPPKDYIANDPDENDRNSQSKVSNAGPGHNSFDEIAAHLRVVK
jgi:hypothetical protein